MTTVDSTKTKILCAARQLFIEHGFTGTSAGKIAQLADVNHSLIFHHFKNKENLWNAVKQQIVDEAKQSQPILPKTHLPLNVFLQQLFTQGVAFYRNNPDIIRLLNWQRLNRDKPIGVTLSSGAKEWLAAFKTYQESGDIDKNLKPEYIVSYTLSLISSIALDPNQLITNENDYIQFCLGSLYKILL
jgi:AcrR family transcriptional regulator